MVVMRFCVSPNNNKITPVGRSLLLLFFQPKSLTADLIKGVLVVSAFHAATGVNSFLKPSYLVP